MTPTTPDHPVIDTPYGGPFADHRPLRNLAVDVLPDLDESRHRLTLTDLVGLTPLLRPWQRRIDTSLGAPAFFDPRLGFQCGTPHRQLHAVRLPRAFSLNTLLGTVCGSDDDYLLLTATGAVSTLSEPELLARYEPLAPPIPDDELPAWAARVAAGLLGPLGDRWRHTVTAARHAEQLATALPADDRPLLVAAAWLHDIGYAPVLAATGLHHLDAALTLDGLVPPRLVGLVAHHTAGDAEAELRHLSIALDCFPAEDSPLSDALTCCDLASGPDGHPMDPANRIDEAIARYGSDHPVGAALRVTRGDLLTACARAARRAGRPTCGSRHDDRSTGRPPGQQAEWDLVLDPIEIIHCLRQRGLMVKDIATALGTRPNRICEWRSGTRHVSPRAYTMLTTLRDTVAEADRHLSGNDTLLWLRATNPALDGHRPLDVVRFDANRVRDAAARIAGHDVSEAS